MGLTKPSVWRELQFEHILAAVNSERPGNKLYFTLVTLGQNKLGLEQVYNIVQSKGAGPRWQGCFPHADYILTCVICNVLYGVVIAIPQVIHPNKFGFYGDLPCPTLVAKAEQSTSPDHISFGHARLQGGFKLGSLLSCFHISSSGCSQALLLHTGGIWCLNFERCLVWI